MNKDTLYIYNEIFVAQSLRHVWLFTTPWTAGFPVYHHLPELAQVTSIDLMMPSNHLSSLCHPLLLLLSFFFNFVFKVIYFNWRPITLQYCSGFCHTLIWISHGCTCIPHPEPPSYLLPHPIPLGHPSAPALSTLSHASNLDWQSISHMIIHMFQCYYFKSSHPRLLPQSPKDCSIHLCLFCCLAYRVIITIFLNSIYMR